MAVASDRFLRKANGLLHLAAQEEVSAFVFVADGKNMQIIRSNERPIAPAHRRAMMFELLDGRDPLDDGSLTVLMGRMIECHGPNKAQALAHLCIADILLEEEEAEEVGP